MNIPRAEQFRVEVDYTALIENLATARKYSNQNDDVNTENYPLFGVGKRSVDLMLFNFATHLLSPEAIDLIEKNGYRPGSAREILTLGIVHPELQLISPIVALGSVSPKRNVIRLTRYSSADKVGYLQQARFDGHWFEEERFVAVKR